MAKQPKRTLKVKDIWNREVSVSLERYRGSRYQGGRTLVSLKWNDERSTDSIFINDDDSAIAYVVQAETQTEEEAANIAATLGGRETWYVGAASGPYRERLHLRWDDPKRHESYLESDGPRLMLFSRTGTWTAIIPVRTSSWEGLPMLFDSSTAMKVADLVNAYRLFHQQAAGGISQAKQERQSKQRSRLGERVMLMHLPVVRREDGRQDTAVRVYGFPQSGQDTLEVVTLQQRGGAQLPWAGEGESYFISGSEVATRWQQHTADYESHSGMVLLVPFAGPYTRGRRPGLWADAQQVFGILMELRSRMEQYGRGGIPSFPIEVRVQPGMRRTPTEEARTVITYLAEYDGKTREGFPRLKLTYQRGWYVPKKALWVLWARADDGFEHLFTSPTELGVARSLIPGTSDEAREANKFIIVKEDREKLMVMLDIRYEQGLRGVEMSDGSIMLYDLEVKPGAEFRGEPINVANLRLQVQTFNHGEGPFNVLSWEIFFGPARMAWWRGTELGSSAKDILESLAAGLPTYFGHAGLTLPDAKQRQELMVWLDTKMESGQLQGLRRMAGKNYWEFKSHMTGDADVPIRMRLVEELGCGFLLVESTKKSRKTLGNTHKYQVIARNGLRLLSGNDIDLLRDFTVLIASVPPLCAAVSSITDDENPSDAHKRWSNALNTEVSAEQRFQLIEFYRAATSGD